MTQAVRRLDPGARRTALPEEQPVREVLTDLWQNTEKLVRQELELATTELEQRLTQAKKDAAAVTVGSAVAYGALLCFLATAILLLSKAMDAWVAALIVGIASAIAGGALLAKARNDIQQEKLVPKRTIRTFQGDVRMLKEVRR